MTNSTQRVANYRARKMQDEYRSISILFDPKTLKEFKKLKKIKDITYLELIRELLEVKKIHDRLNRQKKGKKS